MILGDTGYWVEPALPCHILLWQHTVDRHHVQSISMLPACLQKPLLLHKTHIKILEKTKKELKGTTSNRWSPESPETGRPPPPPGCTGDAAGSRSSPGQIDRSCSPGYTDQGYIIKSQLKHTCTILSIQIADCVISYQAC